MFQTTNQSTYIFLYFPIFIIILLILPTIKHDIVSVANSINQYKLAIAAPQPTSRSTASSSFRWSLFCMIHAWPGVEAST